MVISLATNYLINEVIAEINSLEPIPGYPFFKATLLWFDGNARSSGTGGASYLLDITTTPIDLSALGTNVMMYGVQTIDLTAGGQSRKIEDVFNEINTYTSYTGFSAKEIDSNSYRSYKGLPANLLIPTYGIILFTGDVSLEADFRNTVGAYLLNMSHTSSINPSIGAGETCTCIISGTVIEFNKNTGVDNSNYIGNYYSYDLKSKDIEKFISDSMNLSGDLEQNNKGFSYAQGHGSLYMDVAILPANDVTYGTLRLRDKDETDPRRAAPIDDITLYSNDPEALNTHVYFGFLGDISFYQISDYNLWKQYILVKRRLGLPWYKVNDSYVKDYYVSNDLYKFSDYEYTLNLVQNNKFLYYLKYRRFGELADSLNFEDLYNNKYLWLFLKFHRELGCDQKVLALTKKINEDSQKAKLLS
jgi:hypothetical protein